jgi:cell wall-associated NlpC family hydrolase
MTIAGALPADWEERDRRGCYDEAIRAIGIKVRSGAPVPEFFLPPDPRAAVLKEAREWIGTPYHHMGRVKGVAADCLTFLAEVYERAGIVPHIEIPFYPPDWLHRDEERYAEGVLGYACEIAGPPAPGDMAIFRFGRCFAHGAIVTEWPMLIHAFQYTGVVPYSAKSGLLKGRAVRFFSPFRSLMPGS